MTPTYYVQHPDGSYSVADPQPQQDAQAELPIIRQNKLLADALASCILASGIVRKDIDGLTGPQLLLFAEDLREMLETKTAQQDAQALPPRTFVVMARRRLPSGRYSYTVESDVPLPIGAPLHTDPLNAAPTPPAQRVMLTDGEIIEMCDYQGVPDAQGECLVRAAIDAYERKNGIEVGRNVQEKQS